MTTPRNQQSVRIRMDALERRNEALLAAMKHAKTYIDKVLDKNSYGDAVEGDLLEAHAALDTAIEEAERG